MTWDCRKSKPIISLASSYHFELDIYSRIIGLVYPTENVFHKNVCALDVCPFSLKTCYAVWMTPWLRSEQVWKSSNSWINQTGFASHNSATSNCKFINSITLTSRQIVLTMFITLMINNYLSTRVMQACLLQLYCWAVTLWSWHSIKMSGRVA